MSGAPEFYTRLASWWPVISPVAEYAEEADWTRSMLGLERPGRLPDILELGSGGGHLSSYLKQDARLTLSDLSPSMVAVSRVLNPECEHVVADMRHLRLGRLFDAVLVHDAIDYMTTRSDLADAIRTAWVHLRPGGRAVFIPDSLTETFAEETSLDAHGAPDGRSAALFSWSWDPDPDDESSTVEYVFSLRRGREPVEVVHDTHVLGLFSRVTWHELLRRQGFDVVDETEVTTGDYTPRVAFIATRPGSS